MDDAFKEGTGRLCSAEPVPRTIVSRAPPRSVGIGRTKGPRMAERKPESRMGLEGHKRKGWIKNGSKWDGGTIGNLSLQGFRRGLLPVYLRLEPVYGGLLRAQLVFKLRDLFALKLIQRVDTSGQGGLRIGGTFPRHREGLGGGRLGRYQQKHRDPADCQCRLRVLSHKVGSLDLQYWMSYYTIPRERAVEQVDGLILKTPAPRMPACLEGRWGEGSTGDSEKSFEEGKSRLWDNARLVNQAPVSASPLKMVSGTWS